MTLYSQYIAQASYVHPDMLPEIAPHENDENLHMHYPYVRDGPLWQNMSNPIEEYEDRSVFCKNPKCESSSLTPGWINWRKSGPAPPEGQRFPE